MPHRRCAVRVLHDFRDQHRRLKNYQELSTLASRAPARVLVAKLRQTSGHRRAQRIKGGDERNRHRIATSPHPPSPPGAPPSPGGILFLYLVAAIGLPEWQKSPRRRRWCAGAGAFHARCRPARHDQKTNSRPATLLPCAGAMVELPNVEHFSVPPWPWTRGISRRGPSNIKGARFVNCEERQPDWLFDIACPLSRSV